MRYILTKGWCLRGWDAEPRILWDAERRRESRKLSPRAFTFLTQCDGHNDLPQDEVARHYLELGVIAPAEEGAVPEPRQRYRYRLHPKREQVQWAITGRCNYSCLHCFAAANRSASTAEFSLEECLDIVEQLDACGIERVFLTGGEPLVHPHFLSIVDAIAQRGMKLEEILTNGALVTPELLDAFKQRGMSPLIGVSFDGLGTHDWLRGCPGAEEAAARAIRLCAKAGFRVKGTVNVNSKSAPRLAETCRYLKDLGCGHIFLIRTSEVPRWIEAGGGMFTFADYYDCCLDLADLWLREGWEISLQLFNGALLPANRNLDRLTGQTQAPAEPPGRLLAHCAKCNTGFFIAHDGRVLPCDATEGTTAAFGHMKADTNVHQRSLEDILTDSEFARVSALTLEALRAKGEPCADCPHLHTCRGGCRAFAYGWNGSFESASPLHCTFYRGGYADNLRELAMAYQEGNADATELDPATGLSKIRAGQKARGPKRGVEAEIRAMWGDRPCTLRR